MSKFTSRFGKCHEAPMVTCFSCKARIKPCQKRSFGRMAGDQVKRRANATSIVRPADAQDFVINRHRRNFARAVHNAIKAGADIS